MLFIEFAFSIVHERGTIAKKEKYYWWISVSDKTYRIRLRYEYIHAHVFRYYVLYSILLYYIFIIIIIIIVIIIITRLVVGYIA